MRDKRLWAIAAVFLLFVVGEQCGDNRLKNAASDAVAAADSIAQARQDTEVVAAELQHRSDSVAAELHRVRDTLSQARAAARAAAADARQTATEAAEAIGTALDASGQSRAALTRLTDAHRAEVEAKDYQIAALVDENRVLWARVEVQDSLLNVRHRINADLRAEVAQLRSSVDIYRAAASPSFFSRLKSGVEIAALGAGAGIILWEGVR
jgi:hypothetical protein